ncbi:MAG: hypothetical protein PHR94_03895 [Methylomonas lenta]|nr:hypothetical protein [Methylomonas lenta]
MSELTPIHPCPAVPGVNKIRRNQQRNNNANKQEQESRDDFSTEGASKQKEEPVQHVDEIV